MIEKSNFRRKNKGKPWVHTGVCRKGYQSTEKLTNVCRAKVEIIAPVVLDESCWLLSYTDVSPHHEESGV